MINYNKNFQNNKTKLASIKYLYKHQSGQEISLGDGKLNEDKDSSN